MRTAGLCNLFGLDIFAVSGVQFDPADPPWWTVAILGWLAMARLLQESTLPGWRQRFLDHLKKKPPDFLYLYYRDYANAVDREIRQQQSAEQAKRGR